MASLRSRAMNLVLPEPTARRLVERAQQAGQHVLLPEEQTTRTTTVQLRPSREAGMGISVNATGSFTITWRTPAEGQATITGLSWDAERGSEAEVRQALNVLAGWPIARAPDSA